MRRKRKLKEKQKFKGAHKNNIVPLEIETFRGLFVICFCLNLHACYFYENNLQILEQQQNQHLPTVRCML